MERFKFPPACFKFAGEKIEQFRMTRFSARDAKVIGGAHQADTEMMLPDAIDHEPGNDRVVRGGEPVGKREASSGAVFDRCDFVGGFWSRAGRVVCFSSPHPAPCCSCI